MSGADGNLDRLKQSLVDQGTALDAVVAEVEEVVTDTVTIAGSTTADFVTRHGFYTTMDIEVESAWDINEVFTYLGMNLYFRPINKAVPLTGRDKDFFEKGSLLRSG